MGLYSPLMSLVGQSLQAISDLPLKGVHQLFSLTEKIKSEFNKQKGFFLPELSDQLKSKVASFAFFEPSTRTSISFQTACHRLQLSFTSLPSAKNSSISKGETQIDTIMNLDSMHPDLLVVRSGDSKELESYLYSLEVPVINAGSGVSGHPTQALLDVFSIRERQGEISEQRVLFVGDIVHSRVATSNLELLNMLGAKVAICGPQQWLPNSSAWKNAEVFENLDEALAWATVCMGLRVQTERHNWEGGVSLEDYSQNYCLTKERLKSLDGRALIMHPGPFVRNVDFSVEVLRDPRCIVNEQVANGVFLRGALMASILVEGGLV